MSGNKDSEIELLRRVLKEDLSKREKDAEERIHDILSKKNIEFCSRCSRKVDDRLEWGGKCLGKSCENILCDNCWVVEKKRFCKDHKDQFESKTKNEAEAKKKVFFTKKTTEEPVIVEKEEDIKEKVESLSTGYLEFVKDRMQKSAPDWTHEEWIDKPKLDLVIKDFELISEISRKGLFGKKLKMKVFVIPLYNQTRESIELAYSGLKLDKGYNIVVFVGYKLNSDTIEFVTAANYPNSSLMLVEPKNNLFYTDKKQITRLYSAFFDSKKTPKVLIDILKSLAEKVSDREVITIGKVSVEFGFSEYETTRLLDSCKFLGKVEGTDSYFFKLKY
ncbi:MAG: hypothetical protein HY512_01875 [Candidatus Aenigmarchaeota archaeon]|nr:hypothetical protein [Candidatus Aenigmarchaeota archaeon]